jgi:hypothetical protein
LALAIVSVESAGIVQALPVGDCDDDGRVSVDELVLGTGIALAWRLLGDCPAFDANSDEMVTIDELLAAVQAALGSPPLLPNGDPCAGGGECDSGNCVDDVCCIVDVCPTGQFCAAPNGECEVPKLRMMGPCSDLTTCAEGTIVHVSRCMIADARACASAPGMRRLLPPLVPGTNVVGPDGRFDFEVDATLQVGEEESSPLVTTADLGVDVLGAARAMHVMNIGSLFGFGRAFGGAAGLPAGTPVIETAIDLSSTATVQLLGESADQGLDPVDADGLGQLFGAARATTMGLEQVILDLPSVGNADTPTFSEASALFVGQVESDPVARETFGLPVDDYIASRFSLPDGCEEQLGTRPELTAQTGGRTSFDFSSSVEARFDGSFLPTAYVAYVTNLLNGPGGDPVALACDTRGNVVCGGQVPTGLFRGSTFSILFPVDGVAVLRVFQIVRPTAGAVQPCDPPDCAIHTCTFNVRVD